MAGTEVNGERNIVEASLSPKEIVDSVVYQLVRVDGDGRLVPATDDEVMEVEHLLEDGKSELLSVEYLRHPDGCVSSEIMSSKKSDLEGLLQSGNTEVNSQELNARIEEEKLLLSCESPNSSFKCVNREARPGDQPDHLPVCSELSQPENTVEETAALLSPGLDVIHTAQQGGIQACTEPSTSEPSDSNICSDSKPDFSIFEGEICLDNLTVRELQEAFRATFGRQTSVKDKLWLKRRIAMGLTNSCDVPVTSFIIKDKKIVKENVEEPQCRPDESQCREETSKCEVDSQPAHLVGMVNDNHQDSQAGSTYLMAHELLSDKQLSTSKLEYRSKSEDLMEQSGIKRVRKPTRRYIEELSESETRECNGRLFFSISNSGHDQSSPKSRVRPIYNIGPQGTAFVTRQDSLGGSGVLIPYASRVRRRRPRKNFMALMNFVSIQCQDPVKIMSNRDEEHDPNRDEEHDPKLENLGSSGNNSDENADTVSTSKSGTRRKHHRAWTLCEVMKLVDGVSRYGAGRWSEIKRLVFASYAYRTSVDLKDKWRNLLRASFALGDTDRGSHNSRKHASIPIPTPILVRVRELAEMHTQAGMEFGSCKFACPNGKIVQQGGAGFL